MFAYLCYYMNEDNVIPWKVWEKLNQQYMAQYEKSDWTVREERRRLKALGLIDYGNKRDTDIKICKGLYVDREIVGKLLQYREYEYSIFCYYHIATKDWGDEIKLETIATSYGFREVASRKESFTIKKIYKALLFLAKLDLINFQKTKFYDGGIFTKGIYYMSIKEPDKMEWRGIKIFKY